MSTVSDYNKTAKIAEQWLLLNKRAKSKTPSTSLPMDAAADDAFMKWAGLSQNQFLGLISNFSSDLQKTRTTDGQLIEPEGKANLLTSLTIESGLLRELQKKGVSLNVGFADSPFGRCLIGWNSRGIYMIDFHDIDDTIRLAEYKDLRSNAQIFHNDTEAQHFADIIFGMKPAEPLTIVLYGTPFQVRVWSALASIPWGTVVSYQDVALKAGNGRSVRAAASAVGANPVGFLVPCHRVIRSGGEIGQFGWGQPRKALMIGWERAQKLKGII